MAAPGPEPRPLIQVHRCRGQVLQVLRRHDGLTITTAEMEDEYLSIDRIRHVSSVFGGAGPHQYLGCRAGVR